MTNYSLNLDEYSKLKKNLEKESEQIKKLFDQDVSGLDVKNLDTDMSYIQSDSTKINRNTEFLKDMKKDIYVDETLNVMRDMIKQSMASKN